jgi:DNA-binding GntR family transcriptional regulator
VSIRAPRGAKRGRRDEAVPEGDSTPIQLRSREADRGRSAGAEALPSSERAYRRVRDQILDGTLPPGQRLVELQLATQLDVSRTPIREALRRLIAEGLVATHPVSGLVVREVNQQEVEDIYAIREVLDGLAARLAAERLTEADLARLRLLTELMDESARGERWESVVHLNVKFHEVLYAAAHNERLASIGGSLLDAVRRHSSMAFSDASRVASVVAEHEAVVRALEARDVNAAEEAARHHLATARHRLERRFAADQQLDT